MGKASIKEIWFTTTKKGARRAWFFSTAAGRTLPLPLAEAELMVATGQARETDKPGFLCR